MLLGQFYQLFWFLILEVVIVNQTVCTRYKRTCQTSESICFACIKHIKRSLQVRHPSNDYQTGNLNDNAIIVMIKQC